VPSQFEADLRAAREARGLSLDQIQQQTRIPVDVLRRFEEGGLIGDPTYNEVYLKAFLQAYAKAVDVPTSAVLAAYAKGEAYRGPLVPEPGAEPSPPPAPVPPAAPSDVVDEDADKAPTREVARPGRVAPPAVEALATTPAPAAASAERPQTLAQARVNRPVVPSARRSFDKNWGPILGLFAVLVAVLGGILYFLVFAGDDDGADEPTAAAVDQQPASPNTDSSAVAPQAPAGPRFQTPIRVTVTAGGDGLQWFRVSEDGGDRLPYWIDQGATQTFEADSSLVFWGEGNEAGPALAFEETTLALQGLQWTPASGSVLRIDRQTGQGLLDSLATGASPAPTAGE